MAKKQKGRAPLVIDAEVVVPEWAYWMAQQRDGQWYFFSAQPVWNPRIEFWFAGANTKTCAAFPGEVPDGPETTACQIDRED